MKKVLLILCTMFLCAGVFAQKGNFKKNTISESWGIAIPIGEEYLSFENNSNVGYALSFQHNFSKSFGLMTGLHLQSFKYDEDVLNEELEWYQGISGKAFVYGEATNAFIYNVGIGVIEGTELGNSGVFLEAYEQLALGALKYSVVTIDNDTYDIGTDAHFGLKVGGQIYKMFGGFGVGLNADYTIGFPWATQYTNVQFKLVQKF